MGSWVHAQATYPYHGPTHPTLCILVILAFEQTIPSTWHSWFFQLKEHPYCSASAPVCLFSSKSLPARNVLLYIQHLFPSLDSELQKCRNQACLAPHGFSST